MDLIDKKMNKIDDLKYIMENLKFNQDALYRVFIPLKRIKGKIQKVHRLKIKSYSRYFYLNPIEGVLISYTSVNKFPH